uniref:Uncharacterized protein n=1 Tax=Arundo donax TaxID=35708 RepID=A0A0A9FLR1_ARUDO
MVLLVLLSSMARPVEALLVNCMKHKYYENTVPKFWENIICVHIRLG